jgi:DNA (cytosine-5)-methyltransferase 1
MRVASLFAGIGGIDLAFKQAGFSVIWSNDIDKYCQISYDLNHPNNNFVLKDINHINGNDLPEIDLLVGGFPCQSFSIAGNRKGFEDERGILFYQIIRLLRELDEADNKPLVLFFENVKNLKNHNKGETFNNIQLELKNLGYFIDDRVLNSAEYGNVPQNRERIYIVAFLQKEHLNRFEWPHKIELTNRITDIIKWGEQVSEKFYCKKTWKCYPLMEKEIKNKNTIYHFRRVYVRENKNGLSPTLTANMGQGGHNVPMMIDNFGRIRKLTLRECLLLQGFPETFKIPENISFNQMYKQIGNSVTVPVVYRIAKSIKKALGDYYNEKI